MTKKQK